MRKIFFTICLLFLVFAVNAQDTIRLVHKNYTAVYSKSKKYPVLVEWWETSAKVDCPNKLARKDKFAPDPLLPDDTNLNNDYAGAGFDRGHMCPAAINLCQGQAVQDECFYFSNMSAQYGSLNRGDWKSLETLTRQLAAEKDSIHVWCGSVGVAKTIGADKVAVPTKCWKVIYIVKTKEWQAYIFDNTTNKPDGIENNKVDIKTVEKLTGFKFKI